MPPNSDTHPEKAVNAVILLMCMVSCTTTAQVLFKFAALQENKGISSIQSLILNMWLLLGLAASGIGM